MADYSDIALVRGMHYLAETQGAIAHNLANVNSTGFKRHTGLALESGETFRTVLDGELETVRFSSQTDWTSGSINATGNKLDVALEGPGFLMVQNRAGQSFYTRNGAMLIDVEGRLTDQQGNAFLDPSGQPIVLGSPAEISRSQIRISPDGNVDSNGIAVGKIGVFAEPPAGALHPVGQSLHIDRSGGRPAAAGASATVRQGHLEQANVDTMTELINMISVQRSFQATGQVLSTLGRLKTAFVNAVNR